MKTKFIILFTITIFSLGCGRGEHEYLVSEIFAGHDPVSIDYGELDSYKEYHYNITIQNDMDAPVVVKRTQCSSYSLFVDYENGTIEPGQSLVFDVQYVPSADGIFDGTAAIKLGLDGQLSTLDFNVSADIQSNIQYERQLVFVNNPQAKQEQTLVLHFEPGVQFQVKEFYVPRFYNISIQEGDVLQGEASITISRDAMFNRDAYLDDLLLISEDGRQIRVDMIETSMNVIRTNPERVYFILANIEGELTQKVEIVEHDMLNQCDELSFDYDESIFDVNVIKEESDEFNRSDIIKKLVITLTFSEEINDQMHEINIICGDKKTELPVWVSKIGGV